VTIPRATKAVFYRILVFYLGGVFVIGWCVPFNDPKLVSDTGNANSSPFVIAIENAGIKTLPAIVNACITMATFSAGNSYVYAGSRSLYGLALDKQAPRIFLKTWNRTPIFAVLGTLIFGLLGFMTVSGSASEAFDCASMPSFLIFRSPANAGFSYQGSFPSPRLLGCSAGCASSPHTSGSVLVCLALPSSHLRHEALIQETSAPSIIQHASSKESIVPSFLTRPRCNHTSRGSVSFSSVSW
jgi:hypothetical protein